MGKESERKWGGRSQKHTERETEKKKRSLSLSLPLTFRQGLGEVRQSLVGEVGFPCVEGLGEGGGAGAERGGGEEEQGRGDDGREKEGARRRHFC